MLNYKLNNKNLMKFAMLFLVIFCLFKLSILILKQNKSVERQDEDDVDNVEKDDSKVVVKKVQIIKKKKPFVKTNCNLNNMDFSKRPTQDSFSCTTDQVFDNLLLVCVDKACLPEKNDWAYIDFNNKKNNINNINNIPLNEPALEFEEFITTNDKN